MARADFDAEPYKIRNALLCVTSKSGANAGFSSPGVFCFGNLIGDGDDNGRDNALDVTAVERNLGTAAAITSRFDLNRDGRDNALNVAALKPNLSRSLAAAPAPTVSP